MSIMGTKIFSDEYAAMVRDEYRILLGFGISDEEAEKLMIRAFVGPDDASEESVAIFWLAFALSEWNVGRLSNEVRQRAIEVIDSGVDLKKWERAIEHETNFSTDKRVYNFTLLNDVADRKIRELATATGIDRVRRLNEMRFLNELGEFCRHGSDIAAKAQPIPQVIEADPYLYDILMINGNAHKKYELRKEELRLLRLKLFSSQTLKNVSKPYFKPSPWEEGDVVAMKLKGLEGDAAILNDDWVLSPVISVRKRPVSRILPQLATDDEIIVGLLNYLDDKVPTLADLDRTRYIPFRIIKNLDSKGIILSFYGAKRELNKWEWQVISRNPDFSKELPEFYQSGSIGIIVAFWGSSFAEHIAKTMLT